MLIVCKDKGTYNSWVKKYYQNKTVPTYHKLERFRLVSFLTIYFIFQEQNNDEFVQRDLPISKNICCHIITYYKKGGHRASRAPSPIYKFKVL